MTLSSVKNGLRKKMLLRPKQKSVVGMVNVLSTFCNARKLVLDIYARTIATSKACLQLPELRRLFEMKRTLHDFRVLSIADGSVRKADFESEIRHS